MIESSSAVVKSEDGWYVSKLDEWGYPQTRISDYYPTKEEADKELMTAYIWEWEQTQTQVIEIEQKG